MSIALALFICAPLGSWAAARQFVVRKAGFTSSSKAAPVILHARHHARRRFRALRQAKQQTASVVPVSSEALASGVKPVFFGRAGPSFVPPPEHPPA